MTVNYDTWTSPVQRLAASSVSSPSQATTQQHQAAPSMTRADFWARSRKKEVKDIAEQ